MWVFDGDDWLEDGGTAPSKKQQQDPRPYEEEFFPELQIVEVPRPRAPLLPPLTPFVIP